MSSCRSGGFGGPSATEGEGPVGVQSVSSTCSRLDVRRFGFQEPPSFQQGQGAVSHLPQVAGQGGGSAHEGTTTAPGSSRSGAAGAGGTGGRGRRGEGRQRGRATGEHRAGDVWEMGAVWGRTQAVTAGEQGGL